MTSIEFSAALYIKLGRGGDFESDSIETGKIRFGWMEYSIDDINAGRWEHIKKQMREFHQDRRVGELTIGLNALRMIAESKPDVIWITFYKNKLWWTRLAEGPVEIDDISKFRRTAIPWNDQDAKGTPLYINNLSGKITQTQGYRRTVCQVHHADLLQRTLNGTRSQLATAIDEHCNSLAKLITKAIKELHWKDFETLVDLVFRSTGWIRVSVLGQQAKGYDLELREPIMDDHYVVQIKSKADYSDLLSTIKNFTAEDYRRVFFVVHSPEDSLLNATDIPGHVEIISPERLGELVIDAGLIKWLMDKVS